MLIRLPTQFDPPRTQPTAATPTCGGCCCCCCTIATSLSVSTLTAMHLSSLAQARQEDPSGAPGTTAAAIAGFLTLPVAGLLWSVASGPLQMLFPMSGFVPFLGAWLLVLFLAHFWVSRRPLPSLLYTVATVVGAGAVGFGEVVLGISLSNLKGHAQDAAVVIYLVCCLASPVLTWGILKSRRAA